MDVMRLTVAGINRSCWRKDNKNSIKTTAACLPGFFVSSKQNHHKMKITEVCCFIKQPIQSTG